MTGKPVQENELKKAILDIKTRSEKKVKELLIVEDDEIQLENLVKLLGGSDVRVRGVRSRDAAIKALKEDSYDGAIVDLALADGDGFEICEYIQGNFPKVATIVYTAKNLSPEEERKVRQAAQSILLKSQDSEEELRDEVALFLHRMGEQVTQEKDIKSKEKERAQKVEERSSSKERLEAKVRELEAKKEADPKEKQSEARTKPSEEEVRRTVKDKQILVVDDDIRNIFVIASALENFEATILEALNGKEALQMLAKEDVHLVMMDTVMPEMDGLEAMREIRSDKRLKSLPIIAITGKVQEEDQQAAKDAGANDFIAKPVDYDELIEKVCRWVR
ncbi:MAG: response regulator [Bacteroidota bacterium]